MIFKDRKEAGQKLAKKILKYKNKKDVIVLAVPRGGVPVAYEIIKILHVKFNVIISRKLPLPDNPEAGFGAISEQNCVFLDEQAKFYSEKTKEKIIKEKKQELIKLVKKFREGKQLILKNKIVILVDDGLAMGSTILAAIETCKKLEARKIIIAIPTASHNVIKTMKKEVDEVICLDVRKFFIAVADAYEEWHDVSEKEALKLLRNKFKN